MYSGYDDGDCCACTCVSTEDFTCGDDEHGGYACLDPNAPCDDDDYTVGESSPYSLSEYTTDYDCATGWFSDAICDTENNNADCGKSVFGDEYQVDYGKSSILALAVQSLCLD